MDLRQMVIDRSVPVPESGCWIWEWAVEPRQGYGVYKRGGFQKKAHRAAYEAFIGEIPKGLFVCHRCDTPPCVNPAHLFLGTAADNTSDMRKKGRGKNPIGEDHGQAKLSRSDVLAIRAKYGLGGVSQLELAAEFSVSQSLISLIVLRKKWAHVQ